MKSQKKIAIYTSGTSHHAILSVLVEYFNLKQFDLSIFVIDYNNFNKIINGRFDGYIKQKYISPLDSKKSIIFKLINFLIFLFNGLKMTYYLHSRSFNGLIALDSEWILNLMVPIKFKSKIQFSLILHNVNEYLPQNLSDVNLINPQHFKLYYASYFDKYIVLDDSIISRSLKSKTEKTVFSIQFSYSSQEDISLRNEFITSTIYSSEKPSFVVIGSVENSRRNYGQIIDSFIGISHKKYNLIFLGKVIDYGIIQYADKKRVLVNYFEDYLTATELEKTLMSSHFILYIPTSLTSEYLNKKATGSSFDGPKYGIPVLTNFQKLDHPRGQFVVSNKIDILIEDITNNFNIKSYLKEFGIPAFNRMKFNTLEYNLKYIDIS